MSSHEKVMGSEGPPDIFTHR